MLSRKFLWFDITPRRVYRNEIKRLNARIDLLNSEIPELKKEIAKLGEDIWRLKELADSVQSFGGSI